MSSKLIQKIRSEREEEKLAKKSFYTTLILGTLTLGFGGYFYLNRAREMVLMIIFVFIVGGATKGQIKLATLEIPDGRGGETIVTINFNFFLFGGIGMLDNLCILAIAKNKQKEKTLQGTGVIQLELLRLIKEKQGLTLVDLVLETGLSAEEAREELQALLNSKLIQVTNKNSDGIPMYRIV